MQFLPITLKKEEDPDFTLTGYYFMNILNVLKAMDTSRTHPRRMGRDIVLLEKKIRKYDIFRLRRESTIVIISERIRNLLESPDVSVPEHVCLELQQSKRKKFFGRWI